MPMEQEEIAASTGPPTPVNFSTLKDERQQRARDKRQAFKALPEKNLSARRAQQFIHRWCNSYERMFEVFSLMYRLKSPADRLKLLGMNLTCSDNVGRYADAIRFISGRKVPFTDDERQGTPCIRLRRFEFWRDLAGTRRRIPGLPLCDGRASRFAVGRQKDLGFI